MKFLGYDNVLCISPHPDDTEYSMMGTILKYWDTMFTCLQLCQGGDMDVTTGKNRLFEVENAWKHAGIKYGSHVIIQQLQELLAYLLPLRQPDIHC